MMKYLFLLLVLSGCNPYLTQQSMAPPGRQARLAEVSGFWGLKHYRLKLSEGVALAIACEQNGPCENISVVSANPAIAEVRLASLSKLEPAGGVRQAQVPSAAFVIVGKSPGRVKVRLKSREGERDVVVTVVAAPSAASSSGLP